MSLRPPETRAEARKKVYKAAVDVGEARRRRAVDLVEIQKRKREENLSKKRRDSLLWRPAPPLHLASSAPRSASGMKFDSLSGIIQAASSEDPAKQLEATTQFKRLISVGASIEEVIKERIVPRFVEFLSRDDMPQLQHEAAWVLTNIASGTSKHAQVVVNNGAVPKLVQLLSSPSDDIQEQAAWALANVAGDSPNCRDIVLSHGALIPLLALLKEHSKISKLRIATWALSNFCRGGPSALFKHIKIALAVLQQLIHLNDEDVLVDACWTLSYLSNGSNDRIQAMIDAGVCPRIVELLSHPSHRVLVPALRTLANIFAGDDVQTQDIVENQALPHLFKILTSGYEKHVKKETCWAISYITAGNRHRIQAVIDANIISPLVQLLHHAEFVVKKEALWALANAIIGGSNDQIHFLICQGCIRPLCDLLAYPDSISVAVCLEGLERILEVGEANKRLGGTAGENVYAQMICDFDGFNKIELLQTHDNNVIHEKAVQILKRFWVDDEEGQVVQDFGEGCSAWTSISS